MLAHASRREFDELADTIEAIGEERLASGHEKFPVGGR
jgi:hypothetical protein